MDLKLKTSITKSILSNILKKLIRDKVGMDVDLAITNLEVRADEDMDSLYFTLSTEGHVKQKDIANLLLKK